jgi:hypothetical protein
MMRRPSVASTCSVVPTNSTRNPIRSGVTTIAFTIRACGVTGVMSP